VFPLTDNFSVVNLSIQMSWITNNWKKFWCKKAANTAAEHQEVVMDAWQQIVADFDAEMADGKATFSRKPIQQSVVEEYSTYVMGALSAGSTFNTLGFWKVRI
jgi:hypothetical protein